MKRSIKFFLSLFLAVSTVLVFAQPSLDVEKSSVPTVDELMKLSKSERRAQLEKLDPAERRGLWMQVKRAEFGAGGEAAEQPFPEVPLPEGAGWSNAKRLQTKAVVGTIVYDSGLPSTAFAPGSPFLLGNRFDTHTGIPVCVPGTVSTIQALVVPGPGAITMTTSMGAVASAGFVINVGPQTTMGQYLAIFSTFGPATGLIDSVTFAGFGATFTGSEFFANFGAFASSYVPAFGPGTTLGQGHHGVIANTGMVGPNITNTSPFATNLNGFIRASGVIVPVELMSFEID